MKKSIIGNTDSLRSINRSEILNLLYKKGSLARNQIAEYVGLSPASVTRIVNECIDAELIIEQKNFDKITSAGRRPIPLTLNSKRYFIAGVHIGKFWIDIGLFNLWGDIVSYSRFDRSEDANEALNLIKKIIVGFQNEYNAKILSIGVTLYGQVDAINGIILDQNVLGWKNIPIVSWLERELKIKTLIDTNIYSMAYAEYIFNPLPFDEALLFVSIGTTIGIGTVVNNVVIRGKQGIAGILEHFPWFESSPPCNCGKKGCVTAALSDRSLIDQAYRLKPDLKIDNINDLIHYSKDYPEINDLIKNRAQKSGEFLAKLSALHDPSRLVLSGSLLIDGYEQLDLVRKSYKDTLGSIKSDYTNIKVPSKVHSNVPFTLIGAGTIAIIESLSPSLLLVEDIESSSLIAHLPY